MAEVMTPAKLTEAADAATPEKATEASKRPRTDAGPDAGPCADAGLDVGPLLVHRLSEHAVLPVRGSSGAAGYDLAAAHPTTVPPRGKALVKTDLAVAIPAGCYGRIAPRSSMAWKKHTDVGAGVVDADYRGPVGVVLFNLGEEPVEIARGDRVAQLVLERISTPEVIEVADAAALEATARGAGGFGSTGA